MTYSERRAASMCKRCPSTVTSGDFCPSCAAKQREHDRRSKAFVRALRRDNGLCADCGRESEPYRCATCTHERKVRWALQPSS
jgi:hypothetical protein